jgi:glycosyltransferase involved in cell wall biosynthesis
MRPPCATLVLNQFDVIVLVNKTMAKTLRDIGCTRPFVLWCHYATNQPDTQPLASPAEQALYAGFAMVSQWQANSYQQSFGIRPAAMKVLRNAVSPAFLNSTIPTAKSWLETDTPPVLAYSSTPYRGLDILLLSFATIRAQLAGATLRIFSSMGIYGSTAKEDAFAALYDLARALPGVEYVGPLPHPQLAEAMVGVDIWAYPCTFPETSCIAAMEAMASGAQLITTGNGALPETASGFAHFADLGDVTLTGAAATRYASYFLETVAGIRADRQQSAETLAKQVKFARAHYDWTVRANEWVEWLQRIA